MNYDTAQWHDLFIASAGAAAALAGLVFVAVSINIDRILQYVGVPERALQTVLLLIGALVVSIFGLVPQPTRALGIEVLLVGAALCALIAVTSRRTLRGAAGHRNWMVSRVAGPLPGSVPYLAAGGSLVAGGGGGLWWLLAGLVGALVGAVLNAWVLLVEILR